MALSPDTAEATQDFVAKAWQARGVCLTPTFLPDPFLDIAEAYGLKNRTKTGPALRPALVLIDESGREVWRFTERHARMYPDDEEIERAVRGLGRR